MKIAILAGPGTSTNVLVNFLTNRNTADDLLVIVEQPQSRKTLLRHRMRKLGMLNVLGQVLFILFAVPILNRLSRKRAAQILDQFGLIDAGIDDRIGLRVANINDTRVADRLAAFAPDVVLVNGTRIIRPHIFLSGEFRFINTHAGITPMYRGVHGGYWALWNSDEANFGATIHDIDAGVDTGQPLAFCHVTPSPKDNFATYPLLQQAASLAPLDQILDRMSRGLELPVPVSPAPFSRQWYHPTLWGYLFGLARGVK